MFIVEFLEFGALELGLWNFCIDRCGIFTGIVARDPSGKWHDYKPPSENPESYSVAALQGMCDV